MPLVTQGTRTARKPHICAYCRSTIPVGNKHFVWVWADGGSVVRLRGHEECAHMHGHVARKAGYWDDELMAPDDFREACEEYVDGPFPWSKP